ncbi:unnamed protein product [Caenorhabditis bovis]|uniref:DOMON domain-containing protein n=1 Tax=Caenorhabditis bovis TaxID=2654633 RepID=A0A8S1EF04_9PELO|nr:unnamed protein product [Caenorhabditis bovis]
MLRVLGLSLFVFVAGVNASCACYEKGTRVGRSAPISSAYDSNTFMICYTNPCGFVAESSDKNFGWTHLSLRWGSTSNSNGTISIYDGTDDKGKPIIVVHEGEDVIDGSEKSRIQSTSFSIYVKYQQDGTEPNVYYGTIKSIAPLGKN